MTQIILTNVITTDWLEGVKSEPKIVRLHDDPLALSCAVYRNWIQNQTARFQDLEYAEATPEDRVQAQQIRDYYTKKFAHAVLLGYELTKFRKAATDLLNSHDQTLPESSLGMLYRLPGFYHEDTETDRVFEQITPGVAQHVIDFRLRVGPTTPQRFELTALTRIRQDAKPTERTRFWFRTDRGHALCITAANNNLLFPLMESVFNLDQVCMSGYARLVQRTGYTGCQDHVELLRPMLA
jgi:hypothetical protein